MATKKLNILVTSNLYPPLFVGGYEIMCQYVVEGLRSRGHTIHVLTSTFGDGRPVQSGVHRELRFGHRGWPRPFEVWRSVLQERFDLERLAQLLAKLDPDLIYAWNMDSLSPFLLSLADDLGYTVAYSLHDLWLVDYWKNSEWIRFWRLPSSNLLKEAVKAVLRKRLRAGYGLSFDRPRPFYATFNSRSLLEDYLRAGVCVPRAQVVYPGLPMERFLQRHRSPDEARTRFLYVGQIAKHKGVHTALEALLRLVQSGANRLELTIVGCLEQCPSYVHKLKQMLEGKLDSYVRFLGKMPHSRLPEVYAQHDVLLFPSICSESFGLAQVEAWAGGLTVIGSATGGSAEILKDGVNGLTFKAGDPDDLAAKMRYMMGNPGLRQRLGEAGQRMVGAKFTVCEMVNETEAFLVAAREDHQE
jgi:glycosyltransferase involved in cell wall biosynthesis